VAWVSSDIERSDMMNNRRIVILLLLLAINLVGCTGKEANPVVIHQPGIGKYFPEKDVTPDEMVTILKKSEVSVVSTTHSGSICLQTKSGSRYQTTWKAIPGTDYENTTDAMNLVVQILKEERGLEDFMFIVE
jgi:hypothetical protein